MRKSIKIAGRDGIERGKGVGRRTRHLEFNCNRNNRIGYAHMIKHLWYSTHTVMQQLSTSLSIFPPTTPHNSSRQKNLL